MVCKHITICLNDYRCEKSNASRVKRPWPGDLVHTGSATSLVAAVSVLRWRDFLLSAGEWSRLWSSGKDLACWIFATRRRLVSSKSYFHRRDGSSTMKLNQSDAVLSSYHYLKVRLLSDKISFNVVSESDLDRHIDRETGIRPRWNLANKAYVILL